MTSGQWDAAYELARSAALDRVDRTGQTAYLYRVFDQPGDELRYVVLGDEDIVPENGTLERVYLPAIRSKPRITCWHGTCSITRQDADEGIATTRVSPLIADREPDEYDEHDPRL